MKQNVSLCTVFDDFTHKDLNGTRARILLSLCSFDGAGESSGSETGFSVADEKPKRRWSHNKHATRTLYFLTFLAALIAEVKRQKNS